MQTPENPRGQAVDRDLRATELIRNSGIFNPNIPFGPNYRINTDIIQDLHTLSRLYTIEPHADAENKASTFYLSRSIYF